MENSPCSWYSTFRFKFLICRSESEGDHNPGVQTKKDDQTFKSICCVLLSLKAGQILDNIAGYYYPQNLKVAAPEESGVQSNCSDDSGIHDRVIIEEATWP